VLVAANMTAEERRVGDDVLHWLGLHTDGLVDAITGRPPEVRSGGVPLAPYACAWLYAGG
jgi:amylosucrase